MSKTSSAGRWYSRFALTTNKLNTFIAFIGSVSMTVTAVILGGSEIVIFAIGGGFLLLLLIAYGLDRSGFQREALVERFDQETKKLWLKQEAFENGITAMCLRMTDDELVEWFDYWSEELKVQDLFMVGVKETIKRTIEKHGPDVKMFLPKFLPKEVEEDESEAERTTDTLDSED